MTPYPDTRRLPLSFDPARLQSAMAQLQAHAWTPHFNRRDYAGAWDGLPLRGPAGETHPIRQLYSDPSATAFADTVFLDHAPYFQEVLRAFACPLLSVRLLTLHPGAVIHEHRDHGLAPVDGTVRLHVPITTHPGVRFMLNEKRVAMAPGETWYLDLSLRHSVDNPGPTERTHLVLDCTLNDWLRGLLLG